MTSKFDSSVYDEWPWRAIMIMVPTESADDCLFLSNDLIEKVKEVMVEPEFDDKYLVGVTYTPVKDKEWFMARAGLLYDAAVAQKAERAKINEGTE